MESTKPCDNGQYSWSTRQYYCQKEADNGESAHEVVAIRGNAGQQIDAIRFVKNGATAVWGNKALQFWASPTDRLQDKSVANLLEAEINKKLQKPINNDLEEEEWKTIQKAMKEATNLCIGKTQIKKRGNWFDDDCKKALMTRNATKVQEGIQRNDTKQTEEPTEQEVKDAVKDLKNNKSAGESGLPAEILKGGGETLHERVYRLILKVW
ncbi:hypothetical protein ILUMI_25667 [Ignelater luminosus]|uniref:Uncharacterized protein n=1 Tax=Ignelater luminosus TaxID=2038154 RepID=A0A8K0C812_IGNLU|nr:hypothetical protein ILUMI_25667 [Ignelater luminosus]